MNRLPATVVAVEIEAGIALVEAEALGRRYTAMLVGVNEAVHWRSGSEVVLLFQETEVSLAKDLSGLLSMRNRLPCRVTAIERGRLVSRVWLTCGAHPLASVITTRAVQALQLAVGDEVEGLVKANEMTVSSPERA